MGRLAHLAVTGRLEKALEKARGRRRGQLGTLHIAEIFEAESGEDDDAEVGPAGGQAETSIAVDTTGQHIVIGFNDTRGFSTNPVSVSGFMYSDDGGATFVDGGQLPSPGTDTIGTTKLPQVFGDPEVKYLGGSTFVYFSIMVKKIAAGGTAQTMCVHRSTNNGHTWEGPFEIPPATNPHGLLRGVNAVAAADKEFGDVDPDTGRVLMSWSNFTGEPAPAPGVEISTTFSDNLRTASPPTWSSRVVVAAGGFNGQASIPRFAGNGSNNVYVAWQQTGSAGAFLVNRIGFSRSTDDGVTFAATTPSGALTGTLPNNGFFKTMDQVLGNDRVHNFPSLAVDNSLGPNKGNIYAVYASNATNDGADIVFHRSLDNGVTWSAARRINSRPAGDRAQWFPWVTVDNGSGGVYVFYYDQGIRSAGDLSEVTVQESDDGGLTFRKPMPLSDRPFHAGYGNDTGQPNLGDYNEAVAQNGELFAVFAATTPVLYTDGQPNSSFTTPDVVFKRMPASTSKVPLSLSPVSFTDSGGDGFIDPGETAGFTLPLFNYVTNGGSSMTNVSATLSTPTVGVTVVNATRAYPNIAPGASAVNIGSFDVQIAPSFGAGTPIEFSLAVSSAEGSTALLFTQATGTPATTTIFLQNFDSVAPGTLPSGWTTIHGGGANTVPWTTNNTFMGTGSNAAFHQNANDGIIVPPAATPNPTRFERLASPNITIPADAEYVLLDFDVVYNTEDDPSFNVLAYDGFLLRITDFTPGRFARAVQVESFAEEFTTGGVPFYPKHMPRSNSTAYLQDLSAWAGNSGGVKHVHLKLPGMAGSTVSLRWEYTQDSFGICASGTCGVAVDNVVMRSALSVAPTQTSVTSSQHPSDSGEPVTFIATVSSSRPVTTGTITFKEGATTLFGPTAVDASGQARFTTSALTPGSHTITAEYTDGPGFLSSTGSINQVVDSLPAFSINDVSVAEGNDGTTNAVFTVTLSASTHTATAHVDFATADGTATTADNDYAAGAGSLSFAPGETSHTIAVTVNGDNVFEPDETLSLNLSNATHATIADQEGIGTIVNDDGMPAIAINDVSVLEGNTGTTPAVFTVSLSNPSSRSVSVSFATADGTATVANNDYAAAAGGLVFAPHETTKTVTVSVNGDYVIETNETFTVNLAHASGGTIADGQGVGTIQNDDSVTTTLDAVVGQVTACGGGLNSGQCQALLTRLAAAERDLAAGRIAGALHALEQFSREVETFSRSIPGNGNPPRLDPSTASTWIAEAQSIVAALTS